MGEISNNLYFLHVKFLLAPGVTPTIPLEIALYTKINKMMDLWHHQMGHIREKATRNLLKFVLDVTFLLNDTFSKCKPCIISKHARPPCPLSLSPKSLELLALLFIDLCGPFPVITPHSKSYMIVFMDDCSDAIKVHLLATKDQSYDAYKKTKAAWKLKMGKKVKVIHFDPGGEFVGSEFIASLKADSIFVDIVPQGEHWKNWKMEHCMQTLQRCMLAMITAVQVTLYYWGEAALCSAFLQNIMITSSLPPNVTPFEIFHKHKLNIKFLCMFGSRCLAQVPLELQTKLGAKSVECLFMGYPPSGRGYCVCSLKTNHFFNSGSVYFDENIPYHVCHKIPYDPIDYSTLPFPQSMFDSVTSYHNTSISPL